MSAPNVSTHNAYGVRIGLGDARRIAELLAELCEKSDHITPLEKDTMLRLWATVSGRDDRQHPLYRALEEVAVLP